jgi:hypothetical protein
MRPRIAKPKSVNGFRVFRYFGKWFAAHPSEGVIYHGPSFAATARWARANRRHGRQEKRPPLLMLADTTSGRPVRISSNRHYLESYALPELDWIVTVPYPMKDTPNT